LAVEPLEKAMLIARGMEKRRAFDVMILDMRELMSICDYFIICHGRSQTHVDAIRESVEECLEEHGIRPDHREGRRGQRWLVLDYGSAVGHVFTEEARDYYDLERLWEDAPVVEHQPEPGATEEPGEVTDSEGNDV
jgi:ribosome-associated protein